MSKRIENIEQKQALHEKLLIGKYSEEDLEKININNPEELKELKELISENKTQIKKCIDILDTLLVNYTQLYEKTELIHLYVEGMSESIVLEQQDLRQGLYHVYNGLDIPLDNIKGWDDLSYEQDKTKQARSTNSKKFKIMGRKKNKGKKKNGRKSK